MDFFERGIPRKGEANPRLSWLEMIKKNRRLRIGQRFGKIVVIEPVRGKWGWWWLKCDCGIKLKRTGYPILMGHHKSCGSSECRRRVSVEHQALTFIKNDLKKSKFKVSLKNAELLKLSQMNCYYCGSPPGFRKGMYSGRASEGTKLLETIGLDRKDSSIGYEPGNVVPCCEQCNRMKLDYSVTFFKKHLLKIVKHQGFC